MTDPQKTPWRSAPLSFLKGGAMGAAEAVPGISGGTTALIVGIYDQLIGAVSDLIHALRLSAASLFRRRPMRPAWDAVKALDWPLLVPVAAGMLTFLLIALNTVAPLMESHPVPMNALFFGMIAVSVAIPLRMLPDRFTAVNGLQFAAAAVLAFLVTSVPAMHVADPSLWYVFLAAMIAINALVLPGLSGSALMVVMGIYIPVQNALSDLDLAFIGTYMAGAAIGLGLFSKVLNWLLHAKRQATMAALAGLMVGSLRSLWPWQSEEGALQAPGDGIGLAVVLALAGAAIVAGALYWEARSRRKG